MCDGLGKRYWKIKIERLIIFMKGNGIKMNKNYTVMELEAIKHLCKCVNSVASLPADLIADTNVATNTTYSSYKIDAEMSALENDIQRYVDTALAGLNKLTKEVIDDKALVVKENVLYLYKDPTDMNNNYMQMMLINGTVVELGSKTCDMSGYYTNTEVDDKFALKTDIPTVPTKTSDLTNDSNFITSIPEEYITETELTAKGYLTSHQDISGLQTKTDDSLTTTSKKVVGAINEVKDKVDLKANNSEVVKKTDIVTAIDSSSTDDKVPSAKAVNDILSNVTGVTNVKIYYLLSQLGITTPCTIKDIWDKMPSGSITIVDTDSSIVTDLDVIRIALGVSDDDEAYGILTVVKLEQRTTLEFRRAHAHGVITPDTFIGYCNGDNCTPIQWKRMVITSVEDVSNSDLTNMNTKLIQLETKQIATQKDVDELFQSVSSGKTLVANAITDKGVSTSTTATFATMATNISKIPQTTPWKEETVSATADSTTHIAKFIFSNTVLGIRQLTPVGYHYKAEVKGTKMFTITSNCVEVYLPDGGTWHMTAMVWNSTMT